jgi:hypothetical protein
MKISIKQKIIILILLPVFVLLNLISKNYPEFIETYYSNGLNKFTIEFLNLITGIFPFSVGELLVVFLLVGFIYLVKLVIKRFNKHNFYNDLLSIAAFFSILYIMFIILWGVNYNRLSFDKIAGLKIEKSTRYELYNLCNELITRSNRLRELVKEDTQGIMNVNGSYNDIFIRAYKGYQKASEIHPQLGGRYSEPKPMLISRWMSYTGITGVYIPYTGEANVNTNQPDFELLYTAAHEMAHQRGFAREDEANYIAYLTCTLNSDIDYQYSGTVLALINSMNALARVDYNAYSVLTRKYSLGLRRDLKYSREFWSEYSGVIEKISTQVNDKYLKSNGQEDGVYSYGKMVDLLLAEYKHKKNFNQTNKGVTN